ncbi:outer membrane beta-barrel protein [Spirosoma sp. BT702]|uniref:Outer membrane beta-barrel protein n=1 Tax=Spirosoma profusum TaxID=2771354 RepID=A0A926Y3J4_9BACT|nr:outer membrane beta-barrel protein [Spirosoma profusum]MBD2703458.1 outer membrane beta-barrel protein [Spirosoma profusum]
MKPCLVLLCLIIPFAGEAQKLPDSKYQDPLKKGNITLGFNVGQGYRGRYPTTTFIAPQIQYFLSDRLSVAVVGKYLKAKSTYSITYVGAGASTRYYFIKTNRFTVFGQAGATYGQTTYDRFDPSDLRSLNGTRNKNWQTNAGLGIQYHAGKRLSFEAVADRSWLPASYLTPEYNRWQTSVGVHYRLK